MRLLDLLERAVTAYERQVAANIQRHDHLAWIEDRAAGAQERLAEGRITVANRISYADAEEHKSKDPT
jgi:hypothetical protein